jgi:hypothetical protein
MGNIIRRYDALHELDAMFGFLWEYPTMHQEQISKQTSAFDGTNWKKYNIYEQSTQRTSTISTPELPLQDETEDLIPFVCIRLCFSVH